MAWKRSLLVVANITVTSPELHAALTERAARQPLRVTLVVPSPPFGPEAEAAQERLSTALEMLAKAGIEADGTLGDADPTVAVNDTWDARRHDEVLLSTLPAGASRWLEGGLPARLRRLTNAPVTQVISEPSRPLPVSAPVPAPAHLNILTPFAALGAHQR